MANKSGNAYALTLLCPILQGLPKKAPEGMNDQTYADLIRYQLQRLTMNEDSPMARVPNTYLSRLFVLNDVPYQGRPAILEHLKSNYLVFSSNFHGELEDYLRGMWSDVEPEIRAILQYCVGFDRVTNVDNVHRVHQGLPGDDDVLLQRLIGRAAGSATEKPLSEAGVLQVRVRESGQEPCRSAGGVPGIRHAHAAGKHGASDVEGRRLPSGASGPGLDTRTTTDDRRGGFEMISNMDLGDIQGNIVKAYGRFGFPVARHVFYHVSSAEVGRQFVTDITPLVTTSAPWSDPSTIPLVATNVAFTYEGLRHLDVPEDTLHGFSDEFSMGMKARRDIIGDTGPNHFSRWDPIWNAEEHGEAQHVHILVSISARNDTVAESQYQELGRILSQTIARFPEVKRPGVVQLTGHRGPGAEMLPYQPAAALQLAGKEHFGYSDGISGTFFRDCGEDPRLVIGAGKPTGKDPRTIEGWAPLEPGEFIFGHEDESGAYPEAPGPPLFSRNGTFMVYRKLHQNVASFNSYLDEEGPKFSGGKEALAAKFAGRWRNGAPLATFPTEAEANRFVNEAAALQQRVWDKTATPQDRSRLDELKLQFVAFDYVDDLEGARCPFGAHTRRTNPRSALEFGQKGGFGQPAFDTPGALSNRRRVLRRGLPYGLVEDHPTDSGDHGVIIMILNADLSRQFEFVQQQWVNFGNDFRLANDKDPILGNQGINDKCRAGGRMVIEGDKRTSTPPYFCGNMPTLVETRGGDYFFVPSMTCLRMIGLGIIDPT